MKNSYPRNQSVLMADAVKDRLFALLILILLTGSESIRYDFFRTTSISLSKPAWRPSKLRSTDCFQWIHRIVLDALVVASNQRHLMIACYNLDTAHGEQFQRVHPWFLDIMMLCVKTVVVLGVLFLAFDLSIYRGILLKMLFSSTRNAFFWKLYIVGGTIGGFQESILSLVEKPCGLLQARNHVVAGCAPSERGWYVVAGWCAPPGCGWHVSDRRNTPILSLIHIWRCRRRG